MKIADRQAIALSTYGIESPGIVQRRIWKTLIKSTCTLLLVFADRRVSLLDTPQLPYHPAIILSDL
jgi:hypothetical protein